MHLLRPPEGAAGAAAAQQQQYQPPSPSGENGGSSKGSPSTSSASLPPAAPSPQSALAKLKGRLRRGTEAGSVADTESARPTPTPRHGIAVPVAEASERDPPHRQLTFAEELGVLTSGRESRGSSLVIANVEETAHRIVLEGLVALVKTPAVAVAGRRVSAVHRNE